MTETTGSLAWLFALDPAAGGLERQIYRQVRDAVLARQLAPGTRLPASRTLAASLGVSRGTVVAAFDQLVAEGYLEARVGRGTVVAPLPQELLGEPARAGSDSKGAPVASARGTLFQQARTGVTEARCFRTGTPSVDDFPYREWARCLAARARRLRASDLTYANPTGLPALRAAIVTHINRTRGVVAEAEQVVVIPSAQAGFVTAALCTTDAGGTIAMEDPGYRDARTVFAALGARIESIRVDGEGIDVADLARVPNFKLVAVTPSHQYPTGVTMSVTRRLQLLDLARDRGACILEDDYDSEFRYAERPIASLQGLDGGHNVIYLGTFSKALAPGMRAAYLVLPPSLVEAVATTSPGLGQSVSVPVQAALADFINDGYFAAHIGRMRNLYAEKRAALATALEDSLPDSCTLQVPRGGLQLLVRLPNRTDDVALLAALRAAGLEGQALSPLSVRAPIKGLLLGFAYARIEEIAPAAARLSAIVAKHLKAA